MAAAAAVGLLTAAGVIPEVVETSDASLVSGTLPLPPPSVCLPASMISTDHPGIAPCLTSMAMWTPCTRITPFFNTNANTGDPWFLCRGEQQGREASFWP